MLRPELDINSKCLNYEVREAGPIGKQLVDDESVSFEIAVSQKLQFIQASPINKAHNIAQFTDTFIISSYVMRNLL